MLALGLHGAKNRWGYNICIPFTFTFTQHTECAFHFRHGLDDSSTWKLFNGLRLLLSKRALNSCVYIWELFETNRQMAFDRFTKLNAWMYTQWNGIYLHLFCWSSKDSGVCEWSTKNRFFMIVVDVTGLFAAGMNEITEDFIWRIFISLSSPSVGFHNIVKKWKNHQEIYFQLKLIDD